MPTVIKSYEHTSYYSLYRYLKILVFTVYAKYCNFFLLDCIKLRLELILVRDLVF